MKLTKIIVAISLVFFQFYCFHYLQPRYSNIEKNFDPQSALRTKDSTCKFLLEDMYFNRDGSTIVSNFIKSDNDPYEENEFSYYDTHITKIRVHDEEETRNTDLHLFSLYKQRLKQNWEEFRYFNCEFTDEESKQRVLKQLTAQQKCGIEDCAINLAKLLDLDYVVRTLDFPKLEKREVFYTAYDAASYRYIVFENKRYNYISNAYYKMKDREDNENSIPILIQFHIDKPDLYNKHLLLSSIFFYFTDREKYKVSEKEEKIAKKLDEIIKIRFREKYYFKNIQSVRSKEIEIIMEKKAELNKELINLCGREDCREGGEGESYLYPIDLKYRINKKAALLFENLKRKELLETTSGLELVSEDKLPDVKNRIPQIPAQFRNCVQVNRNGYTIYFTGLIDEIVASQKAGSKNFCKDSGDTRILKLTQYLDSNINILVKGK